MNDDWGAGAGGGESESVVLDLQDLLPDSGGEVVIRGVIRVSTGQGVTATGFADDHVTETSLRVVSETG